MYILYGNFAWGMLASDWGNTCQRMGIWAPAVHPRACSGMPGHAPAPSVAISVKIAGGMWCPRCTEPLQSEIGTPSVNTVGEIYKYIYIRRNQGISEGAYACTPDIRDIATATGKLLACARACCSGVSEDSGGP